MNNAIKELITEIADNPPEDSEGFCRYCDANWYAESSFKEWLKNEEILASNAMALVPGGFSRLSNKHHQSSCFWVRANQIKAAL